MTEQNAPPVDALDVLVSEFPRIFRGRRPQGSYLMIGWAPLMRSMLAGVDATLPDAFRIDVRRVSEMVGVLRFKWRLVGEQDPVEDFDRPAVHQRARLTPEEVDEILSRVDIFAVLERIDLYERIERRVEAAEAESERTCERCGEPGVLGSGASGWMRVRCLDCR